MGVSQKIGYFLSSLKRNLTFFIRDLQSSSWLSPNIRYFVKVKESMRKLQIILGSVWHVLSGTCTIQCQSKVVLTVVHSILLHIHLLQQKALSYLSSCEVSCSLTILLHLVFLVLCNLHQLAQLLLLVALVGQLYLSIGNNTYVQIKICNPFAVRKHKQSINLKIFDSHKMT